MPDANFLTGSSGLIAVDKIGNLIHFLHPDTLAIELTLYGFAPRVHELLIDAERTTAYVPIYGDGIHGDNPHPGHLIARFDLHQRRHTGDFSTAPYVAPHGLRWGANGELYCICENSGVVLEMDPQSGAIEHVIEVGSDKAHRMEILPDGSKLYTENEDARALGRLPSDIRLPRLDRVVVSGTNTKLAECRPINCQATTPTAMPAT